MYCAYKHRGNEGMQVLTLTYQAVPSWDHIIYAITYKYLHFTNEIFQTAPPAIPPHAVLGWSSGEERGQINAYRGCFMKDLAALGISQCWWLRGGHVSLVGWPWFGVTLRQGEPRAAGGKAPRFWKTSSNTQDRQVPRQKKGGQLLSWIQPWTLATSLGDLFFSYFGIGSFEHSLG